jgi:hypothetical protein
MRLKREAQIRFTEIRPTTLGQAARIPGITPADIALLLVWLEKDPSCPPHPASSPSAAASAAIRSTRNSPPSRRGSARRRSRSHLDSLRDFPLPVFDQDLEDASGKPEAAVRLKALFASHHGLLIASPEYNSSITAALKNAIDWVSRADSDDEITRILRIMNEL